MTLPRSDSGSTTLRVIGWVLTIVVMVAILIPVVALTFSVQVTGKSMEPTLHEQDRLLANMLAKGDVQRFDLVEARLEGGGLAVKRVIGLPGDKLAVSTVKGDTPTVRLIPAGTTQEHRVENPVWTGQVGERTKACCDKNGTATGKVGWVTVPAGQYWVLGDNWGGSDDSRKYGFVPATDIGATLNMRLLPLGSFGTVAHEARLVPVD
ncbi:MULTISPECIES: signal peptidase I [unclassified Janibacter]|uniref:signal peptidase I n=1 Tax=unclassified Janibacter TaxID=2649294 RepID=UPI003CFF5D15